MFEELATLVRMTNSQIKRTSRFAQLMEAYADEAKALQKRAIIAWYHISRKHLPRYAKEFAFRGNPPGQRWQAPVPRNGDYSLKKPVV